MIFEFKTQNNTKFSYNRKTNSSFSFQLKESSISSLYYNTKLNNQVFQIMECQQMENPIYKLQRKQFLKKSSVQKEQTSIHFNPLTHRARAIRQRQLSSQKKQKGIQQTKEAATETSQNFDTWNFQISELKREKQELARQLAVKQSQFLQLKLKHIELKQKYDTLQKNNSTNRNENSCDFGDISNISVENSAIIKNAKSQELSSLKKRLQNIKLDKLLKSSDNSIVKSKVLPVEV